MCTKIEIFREANRLENFNEVEIQVNRKICCSTNNFNKGRLSCSNNIFHDSMLCFSLENSSSDSVSYRSSHV